MAKQEKQKKEDYEIGILEIPLQLTHTAYERMFKDRVTTVLDIGKHGFQGTHEARYSGLKMGYPVFKVVSEGPKATPRVFTHYMLKGWDGIRPVT